ncbi:TMEM165/GDT1 family protein [Coprothermobacteraceae bacterium]|nr:TMEM165/GDT1 family protein [Coprothermobacteraceae bacterium]
MQQFLTVFGAIFMAELADKTQFAILNFAVGAKNKWIVFVAAALALTLTSLIAVLIGEQLGKVIPERTMKIISGIIFIAIGLFTIFLKD